MYKIVNHAYKQYRLESFRPGLFGGQWFPVQSNGDSIGEPWWNGPSFRTREEAEEFLKWVITP
jgi:hypothetical protein